MATMKTFNCVATHKPLNACGAVRCQPKYLYGVAAENHEAAKLIAANFWGIADSSQWTISAGDVTNEVEIDDPNEGATHKDFPDDRDFYDMRYADECDADETRSMFPLPY